MKGSFLQTDPMGFNAGDANIYRYVGNNSVNYTDPAGESLLPTATSMGISIAIGVANQQAYAQEYQAGRRPNDKVWHEATSAAMARHGDPFSTFALGASKEMVEQFFLSKGDSLQDMAANLRGIQKGIEQQLGLQNSSSGCH